MGADVKLAAAASPQVHRAVLHSGEEVVVKVQRPGLKQLFDIDLKVGARAIHHLPCSVTCKPGRRA